MRAINTVLGSIARWTALGALALLGTGCAVYPVPPHRVAVVPPPVIVGPPAVVIRPYGYWGYRPYHHHYHGYGHRY
jgi:hypothetical protein